jgi:hypothetical protein
MSIVANAIKPNDTRREDSGTIFVIILVADWSIDSLADFGAIYCCLNKLVFIQLFRTVGVVRVTDG